MDPTFDQVDDRFGNDDPGIIYDAANETGTIEPGIVVTSGSQDGIVSTRDGSTLLNHGEILSASAKGVDFSGDHASVTNFVLARIIGATDGVSFDGPAGSLENHGTILGLTGDGVAFDEPTSAVALTNDGDIFGRDAGVLQISDHTGGRIDNAGSIRSHTDGIVIDTEDGFTTFITNAAGATIRGGVNAIHMELGGINLDNHGTLIGGIFDEANVRDVITNHGKIQGDVDLGGDDDLFNGTGGTAGFVDGGDGNDVLIGGSQADRLFGGDGNDRVNGAGGNDMLGGGAGLDTLTGGPGSDQFVFESILGGNKVFYLTTAIEGRLKIDDWPMAATLGVVVLAVSAVAIAVLLRVLMVVPAFMPAVRRGAAR